MSTTEEAVRSAMAVKNGLTDPDNPWPDRLDCWKKFSEQMHNRGEKIEYRYEDDRDTAQMGSAAPMSDVGGKRVNLFFSNVSVIKESLFNSLPKPSVKRMHFGDWDNEPARVAATIVERGLNTEIKTAPIFEEAIKKAILDRLVPGYGSVWVSFHGATQEQRDENGLIRVRARPEFISVDPVYWRDLIWEPQRTWEQSTWKGRKLHMTRKQAKEKYGAAADNIPCDDDRKNTNTSTSTDQQINRGKVCVIQMWDLNERKVIEMTEQGYILSETPDPYILTGFFPTPKPLMANPPTKKFAPLADYYMAQDQYLEMDILYARINLIIQAVRVAGVYDASVPALQRMLDGTENKLIPVDNWAMFAEKGGAKGVIDWFPVEQVAQVLTHLVSTYTFIKQQLFEVTGMADIVRGSSNQYETAAAQQIKAQFASVRLNGYQRDTAIFVRDILRIMAEMMVQLYSDERLSQICGQLPQADQQFVPQALQLLRNDFLAQCNIDIQADSLTQADWSLEQQQRQAYAATLGGFIREALPVAQANPALAPMLMSIVKFVSAGFKGSSELEGILDQTLDQLMSLKDAKPEPSPEQIKAQQEQQKMQAEMAMKQQDHAMEQQARQQELEFKREEHQMELAFKREEHQMEMAFMQEKNAMQMQQDAIKGQIQTAAAIQKAETQAEADRIKNESKKKNAPEGE